jgi:hypothetical protein
MKNHVHNVQDVFPLSKLGSLTPLSSSTDVNSWSLKLLGILPQFQIDDG